MRMLAVFPLCCSRRRWVRMWVGICYLRLGTFYAGQQVQLSGGFGSFQETSQAGRASAGDPRLSLEERYGTHAPATSAL